MPRHAAIHYLTKLTHSDTQDFHFPVKVLESNGVRLEPFIVRCSPQQYVFLSHGNLLDTFYAIQPSLHAPYIFKQLSSTGAVTFRWFGAELPSSYAHYLTHIETIFHATPAACNFVIYDKSYPENEGKGRIAGTISYLNANPVHKSIEIGFVCILPDFQVSPAERPSLLISVVDN